VSPLRLYAQLVAAMVMWGATWPAGRIVAQALDAPAPAAAMRFTLAALVLWGIARLRGVPLTPRRPVVVPQGASTEGTAASGGCCERQTAGPWGGERPHAVRAAVRLAAMGFFGIFLYNLFFLYGLQHVTAGRGALVVALNPVVVAVTAWWLAGEPHGWRQHLGAVVALAGCLTVIGKGDPLALFTGAVGVGDWLILGCVATWTIYTFLGKKATQTFSPLAVTFWAALIGATLLWGVAAAQGEALGWRAWPQTVWLAVCFMGVLATALGYTWYSEAVHRLGAARAALFINLVPVAGVVTGWLLLDEPLSWPVLVGGLLVLTGVTLTTQKPKERGRVTE
jgi:drug/metabolite transporter (DMT)-like permease